MRWSNQNHPWDSFISFTSKWRGIECTSFQRCGFDSRFSNSLITHEEKTKEIPTAATRFFNPLLSVWIISDEILILVFHILHQMPCVGWVCCFSTLLWRISPGNPGFPLSSKPTFDLISLVEQYRKDSCISPTFLLQFWVKNRGCGLYTFVLCLWCPDSLVKLLRGYQANVLGRSPALFGSNSVVFFNCGLYKQWRWRFSVTVNREIDWTEAFERYFQS